MKIGLLGGSFNPPHAGHLHVSEEALKILGLDQVWWVITPQNPLKSSGDTEDFEVRREKAKNIIGRNLKIRICDIEKNSKNPYTSVTLARLKAKYPKNQFIWLMGEDNLSSIHKWHKWHRIFHSVGIAVFARNSALKHQNYSFFSSVAAIFYRRYKTPPKSLVNSAAKRLPAWSFINIKKLDVSSSNIRNISWFTLTFKGFWHKFRGAIGITPKANNK